MRIALSVKLAAFALVAASVMPAHAQVFVTSITAAIPDPNGKVPGFNLVPGAGIENWSNGVAQAVLTHGQSYNYCVSLASGTANGKASVTYKIARGKTVIQTGTIVTAKNLPIGPDGTWYLCSGYQVLPSSAGTATLTGTVAYTASGSNKPKLSKLSVPVLLQ
jgi:hypothetical protein